MGFINQLITGGHHPVWRFGPTTPEAWWCVEEEVIVQWPAEASRGNEDAAAKLGKGEQLW